MSTHRVDVLHIDTIEAHPNADRLGIVPVLGWRVCVGLAEFKPGDLVAYVPPDSVVDTRRPEFAFLRREGRDHERIKVKRLRGVYSQGLLIKAPDGAAPGDDAADALAVTHYEPPAQGTACDAEGGPSGLYVPVYDIENLRRFSDAIRPGEAVVVTEKLHGTNARFLSTGERFYVGSHRQWKRDGDNVYWRAFRQAEATVGAMLRAEPNLAAYGEVFGAVQELKYGLPPGAVDLRLFDLWDLAANRWLSWTETTDRIARYALPWVPVIYEGPFIDAAHACGLAEGQSTLAGHVREGAVVRLAVERTDPNIPSQGNRVILKAVGNGYLERA